MAWETGRADSEPVVLTFEGLCGFVRGIFRCMRLGIGGFSPKRMVFGRFWAVGNPHDLSKSTRPTENPQTLFRINTTF